MLWIFIFHMWALWYDCFGLLSTLNSLPPEARPVGFSSLPHLNPFCPSWCGFFSSFFLWNFLAQSLDHSMSYLHWSECYLVVFVVQGKPRTLLICHLLQKSLFSGDIFGCHDWWWGCYWHQVGRVHRIIYPQKSVVLRLRSLGFWGPWLKGFNWATLKW